VKDHAPEEQRGMGDHNGINGTRQHGLHEERAEVVRLQRTGNLGVNGGKSI
jgi:hypothetical protein